MPVRTSFCGLFNFAAFEQAFRAEPDAPTVSGNDLRRAWNMIVLSAVRPYYDPEMVLRFSDMNATSSSVRTMVSKLNTIFRFIGILPGRAQINIVSVRFDTVLLRTARVEFGLLGSGIGSTTVPMAGRGISRPVRAILAPASVPVPTEAAPVLRAMAATASMLLESFNPFEGIPENVFAVLRSEANDS